MAARPALMTIPVGRAGVRGCRQRRRTSWTYPLRGPAVGDQAKSYGAFAQSLHGNYLRHDVEHCRCDGIHERLPGFIDPAVGAHLE